MKKTIANTTLRVDAVCPYCHDRINITDLLHEQEYYELRYDEGQIDLEVECDSCLKEFMVVGIDY